MKTIVFRMSAGTFEIVPKHCVIILEIRDFTGIKKWMSAIAHK